jgi:hypothetical protein
VAKRSIGRAFACVLVYCAALFSLQLFIPSIANACSYGMGAKTYTRDELIDKYDAVFLGKAAGEKGTDTGKVFLFQVQSVWKGVDQTEVLVQTGRGDGDCGYHFQLGKNYLVYATSTKLGLHTKIYDATARIVPDDANLDFFDDLDKYEKGEVGRVALEKDVKALRRAKAPSQQVSYDLEFGVVGVIVSAITFLGQFGLVLVVVILGLLGFKAKRAT